MSIPVARLVDDDVRYTDVPNPDTSTMVTRFEPAFILPVFDTGDDDSDVTFHTNIDNGTVETLMNDNKATGHSSEDRFWYTQVLGAYQNVPTRDNDDNRERTFRAHAWPGDEKVIIYQEMLRDWIATTETDPAAAPATALYLGLNMGGNGVNPAGPGRDTREQEILVHEVGHLFGLVHDHTTGVYDGRPTTADPQGGVMLGSCCPPDDPTKLTRGASTFTQISLHKMRSASKP